MKTILMLCSIAFLIIFGSCRPSKTIVDTSCPGYRRADFQRTDIAIGKIGLLPVMGGNNKEQFRRPMGDALSKHFRYQFGDSNVVSTSEVLTLINNANLVQDYQNAIINYGVTGIIPGSFVRQLGQILNVKYLFYTRLLENYEVDAIMMGSGQYRASSVARVDELYIQGQVWGTKEGDVLWEGKGGTAKISKLGVNLVDETAESFVSIVGNEQQNGPCGTKDELISSIHKANQNTYIALLGGLIVFIILFPVAAILVL